MGIRKHLLSIFVVYFGHKRKCALRFMPFYTMDVSRRVLITVEQQIWKSAAQYLSKRTSEYNWIVNRPKDSEKPKVEVFVWWAGKSAFSATPLRSHLKRLKRKNYVECFGVSKAVKTKSILRKLVGSAKTYYWGDGFIGNDLMEYLKVGILELGRKPKVTEKMDTETTEQEPPPPPPPTPPPPSPVPTPPLLQQSKTPLSEVRNSENPDNNQQVKLSQSQVNGLVLKLLSRTTSNVTSISKNVTGVSDELKRLSEGFSAEMINVNSKMDKFAEQLYHKLYDPMFDGDCKCEKCK